jgi:hypothetical protein
VPRFLPSQRILCLPRSRMTFSDTITYCAGRAICAKQVQRRSYLKTHVFTRRKQPAILKLRRSKHPLLLNGKSTLVSPQSRRRLHSKSLNNQGRPGGDKRVASTFRLQVKQFRLQCHLRQKGRARTVPRMMLWVHPQLVRQTLPKRQSVYSYSAAHSSVPSAVPGVSQLPSGPLALGGHSETRFWGAPSPSTLPWRKCSKPCPCDFANLSCSHDSEVRAHRYLRIQYTRAPFGRRTQARSEGIERTCGSLEAVKIKRVGLQHFDSGAARHRRQLTGDGMEGMPDTGKSKAVICIELGYRAKVLQRSASGSITQATRGT